MSRARFQPRGIVDETADDLSMDTSLIILEICDIFGFLCAIVQTQQKPNHSDRRRTAVKTTRCVARIDAPVIAHRVHYGLDQSFRSRGTGLVVLVTA